MNQKHSFRKTNFCVFCNYSEAIKVSQKYLKNSTKLPTLALITIGSPLATLIGERVDFTTIGSTDELAAMEVTKTFISCVCELPWISYNQDPT